MILQVSLHTHVFHTRISVADILPRRFDRMNGPRRQGVEKKTAAWMSQEVSKWLGSMGYSPNESPISK